MGENGVCVLLELHHIPRTILPFSPEHFFQIKVLFSLQQDKDKEEEEERDAARTCDLLERFSGQPDRK